MEWRGARPGEWIKRRSGGSMGGRKADTCGRAAQLQGARLHGWSIGDAAVPHCCSTASCCDGIGSRARSRRLFRKRNLTRYINP